MMAGGGALLFVTCLLVLWIHESSAQRCAVIPWSDSYGPNPIEQHEGNVVLVALMKGYCGYCVQQAQLLQALYNRRHQIGLPDLSIVIVNGGEERSANNIDNIRNVVSFDVLQDSPDHFMYGTAFRGQKDDHLIFDRCGQRLFQIPFPFSNLAYNYTEDYLRYTHQGSRLCYCRHNSQQSQRTKRSIHNTMSEDISSNSESAGELEAAAAQYNFLECSVSDVVCQRFQNIFNQMNAQGRVGADQNRFETRFGAFVDRSDFSLENEGPVLSHGSRMGIRGSSILQRRHHPSRQRNRFRSFTTM